MATSRGSGRVFPYPDPTRRARLVARTRPAGQDPWPGPDLFRVSGFFPGPKPAPTGPHGPRRPCLRIGPNSWPNQKKKNLSPNLFLPTFKPAFYSVCKLVFPVLLLIENKFQTELIYDSH